MRNLLFRGLLGCIAIWLWCASCVQSFLPPAPNSSCSPWLLTGQRTLWELQEGFPDQFAGCLVAVRGADSIRTSLAQINRQGDLRGWDGQDFSSTNPLQLLAPSGDASSPVSFFFYAAHEPKKKPNELFSSFCQTLTIDSYKTCMTSKPRTCTFVIAFLPSTSANVGVLRLPEASPNLEQSGGPTCRLFYPKVQENIFQPPTQTPQSCQCDAAGAYQELDMPFSLTQSAQTFALSPNGKILLAASANNELLLFERSSPTETFGQPKQTLNVSEKVWRLRFGPNGKYIAIGFSNHAEIWELSKALINPSQALFFRIPAAKASTETLTDIAFRNENSLAVSFSLDDNSGFIEIWQWDALPPKTHAIHIDRASIQSLAFDQTGLYLFAGGKNPFQGVSLANLYVYRFEEVERVLRQLGFMVLHMNPRNTYVTSIAVHPSNQYVAVGTSPDVHFLRSSQQSPPDGDHGRISIFSTQPLATETPIFLFPKGLSQAHTSFVRQLAFSRDGEILFSLGGGSQPDDRVIHLWRSKPKEYPPFVLEQTLSFEAPSLEFILSPDCHFLWGLSSEKPYTNVWKGCTMGQP